MIQSDGAWRSHFHFSTAACWASASATVSSTPPSLSTDHHHHHHLTLPDRCDASLALLHHIDFLSHSKRGSKHGNLRHLQIESVSLRCCTYQIRQRDTHDKWQDILLISGSSHVSSSLCVFKIDSTRRAGESHPEKTANVDRDTLPSVNTAVCRECWCAHKRARRKKK